MVHYQNIGQQIPYFCWIPYKTKKGIIPSTTVYTNVNFTRDAKDNIYSLGRKKATVCTTVNEAKVLNVSTFMRLPMCLLSQWHVQGCAPVPVSASPPWLFQYHHPRTKKNLWLHLIYWLYIPPSLQGTQAGYTFFPPSQRSCNVSVIDGQGNVSPSQNV